MSTEYYYPHVGNRQARDKWRADGGLTMAARARRKAKRILETHQPRPIPREIDAAIRQRFRIYLTVELSSLKQG
jgi:trimethylamine--corrinoid protein Co-methyltransferase